MPGVRVSWSATFLCALLVVGCPGTPSDCPQGSVTAEPMTIPEGVSETDLFVDVHIPFPVDGLVAVTELSAISGTIADPFARATTYACAHDISGPVEVCVKTVYVDGDAEGGASSEVPNVETVYEYLRAPHVRITDPLDCSETRCTTVICPMEKNVCPEVSSVTVEPTVVPEGGDATIEVVAEDPDDGPEALLTTLSSRHGTIIDPNASQTTYVCDENVGGVIEICVVASDGDPSCDDKTCTTVRCPGDPLENTCPIVEDLTVTPATIPPGMIMALVSVDATDPDDFPEPLHTALSSATGVFDDRFATETTFTCGDSGPIEICVEATDGDPTCDDEPTCTTVQCPSDIPVNLCPMLFVINAIPSTIASGETSTMIQTRGQDTDGLPFPLVLTLNALWGSFENTDNIQEPQNVVAQNATYVCDRPGDVEICVDATDGACLKTLCTDVRCPADVPTPP